MRSTAAIEQRKHSEHFPSTRWTLIFRARQPAAENTGPDALNQLCKMYWRPALAFLRREGYQPAEAEDLVQEFFAALIDRKLLGTATPLRGRFRSLLLKSLKNFSIDAKISAKRQKRGGKYTFISSDRLNFSAPASYSAEAVFDIEWAITVAEQAVRRLREECESKGQRWLFDELISYLDVERTEISYRALSAQMRLPEKMVKHLLHGFRKRYRTLLREEVAKTLDDPGDVDAEIRYLCEVLALAGG